MKKKKVLITVNTIQSFDDESEEIELVTEGVMYKKEGFYLLEYDESEISGMKGTKTSIEIWDKHVKLIREGTTNSKLVFNTGIEHVSLYGNEQGAFEIIIKPRRVNIDVSDIGGTLELDYLIETQGVNMSENKLVLTIKELR